MTSPPSSSAHTAGPWKYDGDGFDSEAAKDFDTDGYIVMSADPENDCDPICEICLKIDDAEAEANARLIATAPELLEVTKNWVYWAEAIHDGKNHPKGCVGCISVEKAKSVLAKVEGN